MKTITRLTPAEALIVAKIEESLEDGYSKPQAYSRAAAVLGLTNERVAYVYADAKARLREA